MGCAGRNNSKSSNGSSGHVGVAKRATRKKRNCSDSSGILFFCLFFFKTAQFIITDKAKVRREGGKVSVL